MNSMLIWAAVVCLGQEPSHPKPYDPDDGTLSSTRPRIAEPMVFDLIRPLGAKRGEFEVNSLFRWSADGGSRPLLWAPEVEFSFLDGYGIELELPMRNQQQESFKGALQGTMSGPWEKRFIHGWQAIFEGGKGRNQWDGLYLAGVKWNEQWSVFSMTGGRLEGKAAFVGNYTLFYARNDQLTYGFETNWKGRGSSGRNLLLMPQIQIRRHRVNVQLGVGWRRPENETSRLVAGWRISREY